MLDFSKEQPKKEFEIITDGTYEVVCTKCCQGHNNFNEPIIILQWKIRDDVEQGFKNRVIFDDIKENTTESKPDHVVYNDAKLSSIIQGGFDKTDPKRRDKFEDYDDICQFLNGVSMRVDVITLTGKNSGKKFNCIKNYGYHPSQAKPKTLGTTTVPSPTNDGIDVIDDDLPF